MALSQRSPYTGYDFTVPPHLIPPIMHPAMYIEDPQVKVMQQVTHNCVQKTLLSGAMGFVMGGAMGLFMASMRYDTPFHTPSPGNTPSAVHTGATASAPTHTSTSTPASASTTTSSSALPKPSTSAVAASTSISSSAAAAAARASAPPTTTVPLSLAAGTATATVTLPAVDSMSTWGQVKHGFRDMGRSSYSTAKNFSKVGAIFAGVECGIEGLRGKNDFVNPVAAGCLTGGILAMNAGPQAAVGGCVAFAAFSAAIEAWLRSDSSSD